VPIGNDQAHSRAHRAWRRIWCRSGAEGVDRGGRRKQQGHKRTRRATLGEASSRRPRPPENGDGDGPRGRARCHLCELAYCERTSAEPPETTDLIRFCPPLHPFVSERASYGKVAQMVFSWGRASANNYLDSHRPREGRVFTYSQVLAGLGMCSTERFVLSSRRILLFDRCIACPSAFPTRSSCC
jgi:hypothetical protein